MCATTHSVMTSSDKIVFGHGTQLYVETGEHTSLIVILIVNYLDN